MSAPNILKIPLDLWPRQLFALHSPASEQLFGGESEGGKSHYLRALFISACLDIPGLQCLLVRKNHQDLILNHVEGPTGFKTLLAPLIEEGHVSVSEEAVRFKVNGSLIALQHCQDERKLTSMQGVEKHLLGIDEAPQIVERLIRFMRGWVRMPLEMRRRLPEFWQMRLPGIVYTGNPLGPSVRFFRLNFVAARPEGAIEKVDGFTRQFVRSGAEDNLSVDIEAHHGRIQGFGDAALISALKGNWYTPTGDFFPEWDESRHVVPDFTPPSWWFRFRTFDWGTAEPFACLWWAVSDGEMFEAEIKVVRDGKFARETKKLWFPRGALVAYREWYGADPEQPAKGLRLRNEEMARGILERSYEPCEKHLVTLTDSFVFPDRGEDEGKTIAKTFYAEGVPLTLGRTARKAGWSQMRARLRGIQFDSNSPKFTPMMFFVESCFACRDYIPALPRHPSEGRGLDDAAEHGEATHINDVCRLAAMAEEIVTEEPEKPFDTANLKQEMTFNDAVNLVRQHKARENGAGY